MTNTITKYCIENERLNYRNPRKTASPEWYAHSDATIPVNLINTFIRYNIFK